ncbi:MAG TPA: SRPBCC family protein [Pseudomonadales bacterium]|nr:SRPBCC family protein [Pseudomonadales bacterium]
MPHLNIKTSTTIHATPEVVYGAVTDFSSYSAWNVWIPNAKGECRVGSQVTTHHKYFGKVKHQLIELSPPERLRWDISGWQRHFVNVTRDIAIFAGMEGNTLYMINITMTGPCARIAGYFLRGTIRRLMREEVLSLKSYCERTAGQETR